MPVADGLEPGAGAVAAAISVMVGRDPDVVVGKPGTLLLEMALKSSGLSASECAIVGDTPESDIAAGNALGMRTVLVLTGNSDGNSPDGSCEFPDALKPDHIIESVLDLMP